MQFLTLVDDEEEEAHEEEIDRLFSCLDESSSSSSESEKKAKSELKAMQCGLPIIAVLENNLGCFLGIQGIPFKHWRPILGLWH